MASGVMMPAKVTIAVVPRDRFSVFRRCIDAIYASTHVPFRLLVVTGGTDNATKTYLRELERRQRGVSVVYFDHFLAQGEAREIALRHTDDRFVVLLENDTIMHDNWLVRLLECIHEERAAMVAPLVLWYRGVHAAGCVFEERGERGVTAFRHKILYTEIRRKQIDYAETHCVLLDREHLPFAVLFDDVEPFDADLGLTLRRHRASVFLEPRAVATYSAPPPLHVGDVGLFRFRWDPAIWAAGNRRFMAKWGVRYDPAAKIASYRRQQLKLGLARWWPNRFSVATSNATVSLANLLSSGLTRRRQSYSSG